MIKIIQQLPLTADDVIDILQSYKPAAMKVFRNKVNLFFDPVDKEIKFEIPSGGYYSKKVVYHQLSYRVLKLEELIKPVYILRLVDEWIEMLTVKQAEVIFWRYINHDFEPVADETDWRIRYKTLSSLEISKKLNLKRQTVDDYANRAIARILKEYRCDNEVLILHRRNLIIIKQMHNN